MIEVKNDTFMLQTENTAYCFCVDKFKGLKHIYYGAKIPFEDKLNGLVNTYLKIFTVDCGEENFTTDELTEFSSCGVGDFRPNSVLLSVEGEPSPSRWEYQSYRVIDGCGEGNKMPLPDGERATTLIVALKDFYTECILELYYTLFEGEDVLLRRCVLRNDSRGEITVKKLASMNLDIRASGFDLVYLGGGVSAREASPVRSDVGFHTNVLESRLGVSGHYTRPFYIVCDKNADENGGECYATQLMYSGNFKGEIHANGVGDTRMNIGVNDYLLSYPLQEGESFETPCALLAYSSQGFNGVSVAFQRFIRNCVTPPAFRRAVRPVVVNTWEAFDFTIDEKKCLQILSVAKQTGADVFTVDDGWFGRRDAECRDGLGDWWENPQKFPNGLERIATEVKKAGMRFGLWIEPEMVNPKSDLFKEHPDWALQYDKGAILESRRQYALDFSNPAVVDYLYEKTRALVERLGLAYIKMDMNRYIPEMRSTHTPTGKLHYEYVAGCTVICGG